jgi:hypothetical protein
LGYKPKTKSRIMSTENTTSVVAFTSSVITKDVLLQKVKASVAMLPTGTCFVAGVTKVKDFEGKHQMMLEIVQAKDLRVKDGIKRKENMTGGFMLGDSRFSVEGDRTVRVWMLLTVQGYVKTFPQLNSQLNGTELYNRVGGLIKTATSEEVLCILTAFDEMITPSGLTVKPSLCVTQYSDPMHLPAAISKILNIEASLRSTQQEKSLEGMMMYTGSGDKRERLVDEYGNQVYEMIELTYVDQIGVTDKNLPIYEVEPNKIIVKQPFSVYEAGIKSIQENKPAANFNIKEGMGQLTDLIA